MNSQNKDWWRKADIQRAVFSPDWEPTLTFLKKRAHKIEDEHPRILKWDVQRNLFSYVSPGGLSFDGILVFCGFIANLKDIQIAKVSLLFNELDGWTIYEYEVKPETGGYHG